MRYTLSEFTNFLNTVRLAEYREKYSQIKIVEMDLPKNIQAIKFLYEVYWDKENKFSKPLMFDEFYDYYYDSCKDKINEFWDKSGFGKDCDCFQKGLKARIYRTWASLITQIHAGYVAESVFGEDSIEMGAELDYKNVDILAKYKGQEIKIQIKKESHRPEIARMYNNSDDIKNEIFNIWYVVPTPQDYENPFYKIKAKEGQYRDSVKPFLKYNKNGTLDRLSNGFVIFTTKEFEIIKQNIDSL